jgi:F420-dependent oxidoreductase-like protein
MSERMRVGLFVGAKLNPIETHRAIWRIADEAGFDHVWHDDHLLTVAGGSPPDLPILEAWTLLGAMAEATNRVHVGTLVTANLYRNPGMLAKMAATVDHISGGRLEMAIGTGWAEREFTSLGMPFAETPERIDRMDEACSILRLLWTQARSDFDGRFYSLVDAICEPKPVQQPHPPIWIGGRGPKRTLRVAARQANVWNSSGSRGLDADLEATRILNDHCVAIGRDPTEIRRSTVIEAAALDDVVELADQYAAAGFSELILGLGADDPIQQAETVAVPALARILTMTVGPVV